MVNNPCPCCLGTGKEQDPARVGQALKKKRRAAGKTLREISLRIGVSISYLSCLESGKRNWSPSLREHYLRSLL